MFEGGQVDNGRLYVKGDMSGGIEYYCWQYEMSQYGEYTIEADFQIEDLAAGLAFAKSPTTGYYYMWQINKENHIRPHVWNPGGSCIEDKDMSGTGVNVSEGVHHLRIEVTNNARKATTYIDNIKVDERTGSFVYGPIGFRQDAATDNSPEAAWWDNIRVTTGGTTLFEETFDDPYAAHFPNGIGRNGGWFTSGYLNNPVIWQGDVLPATVFECDVTVNNTGVGFIQGWTRSDNFQLWSVVECEKEEKRYPAIRRHAWRGDRWSFHNAGGEHIVRFTDGNSVLGRPIHLNLVRQGDKLIAYLNGYIVEQYNQKAVNNLDVEDAYFGFRMDGAESGYVDNIKVTDVSANGTSKLRMQDDCENEKVKLFNAPIEFVNGSNQYKLQASGEVKFMETSLNTAVAATNKWGSYAPAHNVTVPNVEGLTVMVVTDLNEANNSLTIATVDAGTTVATGEGLLLYAPDGAEMTWNYSTSAPTELTNLLSGTTYTQAVDDLKAAASNTIFALANKGQGAAFYPVSSNIPANKAYLEVANASSIRQLGIGTDNETAIDAIETTPIDGTIYDLSGRKVNNLRTKGLYIVGGKKMLVK